MGNCTVLGLVCSPNKDGRTNTLVQATLDGAAAAGAQVEKIQVSDYVVAACKDCVPWVCNTNRKCTYEDEAFDYLCEKILKAGALVLGTPVYWSDTSGLMRYLALKMYRIHGSAAPLKGVPAVGIAIAGGTGNGLCTGLHPVYHFLYTLHMKAIKPFPSTKFNFSTAIEEHKKIGAELAGMAGQRYPFAGMEERALWYDTLPYINLSRIEERRLLASQVTASLGADADQEMLRRLIGVQGLLSADRKLDALMEIGRVYEMGTKAFARR